MFLFLSLSLSPKSKAYEDTGSPWIKTKDIGSTKECKQQQPDEEQQWQVLPLNL